MIMIASVARGFGIDSAIHMFEQPGIAIGISTFDLVRCGCSAPKKPLWKFHSHRLALSRNGVNHRWVAAALLRSYYYLIQYFRNFEHGAIIEFSNARLK